MEVSFRPCLSGLTLIYSVGIQLVDRGNAWAGLVGATENVRFEVANATVSLQHMLGGTSPYPGPLSLVTIQFPGVTPQR